MAFFRWILSHLTLIIIFSFAVYIYWVKDEIWPVHNIVEDVEQQPVAKVISHNQLKAVEKKQSGSGVADAVAVTRSSNDFVHRMEQYRQTLSVEEREAMDSAEKTVQYAPVDGKIEYPVESEIEAELTQAEKFKASTSQEITEHDDVSQQEETQHLSAEEFEPESETQIIEVKKKKKESRSKMQTTKLQKEIRNRQKELQSRMLMLIPVKSEDNKPKSVKPQINTPEQRRLLIQARVAFDEKKYYLAENKYKQLSKQLPELPDVMGELANVYRTQNKTSEYLAANTKFVTRLVNHNRFDEAWRIFSATGLIDKKIAAQQRVIIKRKQAH